MTISTVVSPPLTCPPRFGTTRNPDRPTLGGAVGEVARLLGKPFMPWQQYVADVISELDPSTGEFAYEEWGLTVPRQSGKSTLSLAKNVHRGSATRFFGRDQAMVYTAQTRKDARLKFEEDFVKILRRSRAFMAPATDWHPGNGNEHIRFRNGSRWFIEANTEKAGHGGTLDEGDIDEAFAHVDSRLELAFEPAMLTRRNTRLGVLSTAGWSDGSPYLQAKVRTGREAVSAGVQSGLAYFEWSAPSDAEPGDVEVWAACMPALRHEGNPSGTQPLVSMQRRYRKAINEGKLNDFRRSYLNQWVPRSSEEPPTISEALWARVRDDTSVPTGPRVLAVDVTHDRSRAFLGTAAVREDGRQHIQLLSQLEGTEHVLAEVEALREGRNVLTVVLDPHGAAGTLVVEFEKAGVPVTLLNSSEVAQACGAFHDGLVQGRYRVVGHDALDGARGNAVLRASTRGASRWYPLGEGFPVAPLYAVTLAARGLAACINDADSVYESRGMTVL